VKRRREFNECELIDVRRFMCQYLALQEGIGFRRSNIILSTHEITTPSVRDDRNLVFVMRYEVSTKQSLENMFGEIASLCSQ